MGEAKTTSKASKATKPTARGLSGGKLLALYLQAVEGNVSHETFLQLVLEKGGYRNRTAARARLNRLKRQAASHGVALVPLRGQPRLGKSTAALLKGYGPALVKM